MNTYIFNAFIIVIIFAILQFGVILTMLFVRNNKDDKDAGILRGKNLDCQATWNRMSLPDISLDQKTCFNVNVMNYEITTKPTGDGTKCLYPPPTTVPLNKTTKDTLGLDPSKYDTARNAGALYLCKSPVPYSPTCQPLAQTPDNKDDNSVFYKWLVGSTPIGPLSSPTQAQQIPTCVN